MIDRDAIPRPAPSARSARARLRARLGPIVQTAVAAAAAWYIARLLLDDPKPVFASIAAVISVGATNGQRRERAVQLVGGVVLGIAIGDLLVHAIGTGTIQIGALVVLAMSAAVLLGGGELLVTEAAVSAILLATLEPSTQGLSPERVLEALIGGGVALVLSTVALPLDPLLPARRAAQTVFGRLGRALEEAAGALGAGDGERAARALQEARGIDSDVRALEQSLADARDVLRFAPGHRAARAELARYVRLATQLDFAVRNGRVLARHVLRYVQAHGAAPPELVDAVDELAGAVWALAAEADGLPLAGDPDPRPARAAARATEAFERHRELALSEVVAQVRSTAIDLIRAGRVVRPEGAGPAEAPTQELLATAERE